MTSATASDQQAWAQTLEELLRDIEQWCQARGWAVSRSIKVLHESRLGDYEAPTLAVRGPRGVTYVEPVARYVSAADGLVDLYAWPTLRRLVLVRKGQEWSLKTDSGVPWRRPWNEETFADVVEALHEPG